jgi:hypothetical protein
VEPLGSDGELLPVGIGVPRAGVHDLAGDLRLVLDAVVLVLQEAVEPAVQIVRDRVAGYTAEAQQLGELDDVSVPAARHGGAGAQRTPRRRWCLLRDQPQRQRERRLPEASP